jgi:hypothetical protein
MGLNWMSGYKFVRSKTNTTSITGGTITTSTVSVTGNIRINISNGLTPYTSLNGNYDISGNLITTGNASIFDSYLGLFDGNTGTTMNVQANTSDHFVKIGYPTYFKITGTYYFVSSYTSFSYYVQGSNDETTWTDVLGSSSSKISFVSTNNDRVVNYTTTNSYLMFKIIFTNSSSNAIGVAIFDLVGNFYI